MKTREQALDDLRHIVAEQGKILDALTPDEAADRAYRPGGASRADLAAEFAQTRCRVEAMQPSSRTQSALPGQSAATSLATQRDARPSDR